jgi:hypothetical protein
VSRETKTGIGLAIVALLGVLAYAEVSARAGIIVMAVGLLVLVLVLFGTSAANAKPSLRRGGKGDSLLEAAVAPLEERQTTAPVHKWSPSDGLQPWTPPADLIGADPAADRGGAAPPAAEAPAPAVHPPEVPRDLFPPRQAPARPPMPPPVPPVPPVHQPEPSAYEPEPTGLETSAPFGTTAHFDAPPSTYEPEPPTHEPEPSLYDPAPPSPEPGPPAPAARYEPSAAPQPSEPLAPTDVGWNERSSWDDRDLSLERNPLDDLKRLDEVDVMAEVERLEARSSGLEVTEPQQARPEPAQPRAPRPEPAESTSLFSVPAPINEDVSSDDDIIAASQATELTVTRTGNAELAKLLAKVQARLAAYDV